VTVVIAPGHFLFQRPDDWVTRSFADGLVVYDESDGSVRALNPTAGVALEICKAATVITAAELADRLGLSQPSQEELDSVVTLLQQMESMGFLEHVPT
jgi:hypothetical protein